VLYFLSCTTLSRKGGCDRAQAGHLRRERVVDLLPPQRHQSPRQVLADRRVVLAGGGQPLDLLEPLRVYQSGNSRLTRRHTAPRLHRRIDGLGVTLQSGQRRRLQALAVDRTAERQSRQRR
jgi:hypothetical protein